MHNGSKTVSRLVLFLAERFSTPNPTVSARFHYFYHAPSSSQASDPPARSDLWCCVLFCRLSPTLARLEHDSAPKAEDLMSSEKN